MQDYFRSRWISLLIVWTGGLGASLHGGLASVQVKLLCSMHKSNPNPTAFSKLHSATDLALRTTKMTAQVIRRSMASLVVLERHLWLNLMEIKDADKIHFLDSPTGLFGPAVEGFTECFTAAQKSSQAMQHFLPKRSRTAAASNRQARAPPLTLGHMPPSEVPGPPAQVCAGLNTTDVFLIYGTGRGEG